MLSCGVQGKGFLQIIFSIGIFTPALDRYMTFPNKVIHSFIKNNKPKLDDILISLMKE